MTARDPVDKRARRAVAPVVPTSSSRTH
ncbi:hypothetical protein IEO21_05924 [Rhodonia placenta]|uniref:Uncharacterized protein n=1 Tax=Rhodonia placenta TaxID=104341 RepID=A0A8H7P1A9_9APHY|nr:hypothetical protein IEO21_05924 [Postia placenta]